MTIRRARAAPLALLVAFGLGLLVHLVLRERLGGFVDADEAVVAIMAKHVAEGKGLPAFYAGQPYLGALEAWLGGWAGLGRVPDVPRIRLVLVGVWAALALATAALARALAGSRPAAAAAAPLALALVALPPPDVLFWHLRLRGGFLLGAALLALALAAAVRALERPRRPLPAAGFGLLAGLAFWTVQLTLPACLVVGGALLRRGARPALVLGAFFVGSAPLWLYNLAHPAATFRYLAAHALANAPRAADHLSALVTDSLPRLCGGHHLAQEAGVAGLALAGPALLAAGLAAVALARGPGIVRDLRARRPLDRLDLMLLAVLALLPARRNGELNQTLHLAPLFAALLASAGPVLARPALVAIPAALLALAAGETASWIAGFRATSPTPGLVRWLDEHGIDAIHAEHRVAWLVAWHSGERIAAAPTLSPGYLAERFAEHTRRVHASPHPAFVVAVGTPAEDFFAARLRAHGILSSPETVGPYRVWRDPGLAQGLLVPAAGCAPEAPGPVDVRVLLAGDAGRAWNDETRRVMGWLAADAADPRAARRLVVWLGDNVYDGGLPAAEEGDAVRRERANAERRLGDELAVTEGSGAEAIFVPGNHDWDLGSSLGWGRIRAQEQFVAGRGAGAARLLPGGGCPGPVWLDLAGRVRLVVLDTQWLQMPDAAQGAPPRPVGEGTGCRAGPADGGSAYAALDVSAVQAALTAAVGGAEATDVLVVAHHPLRTLGPHGTAVEAERRGGFAPCLSAHALCAAPYRAMRAALGASLAAARRAGGPPLLVWAAGHDHSLQVVEGEPGGPDWHLVSGAGSSPTAVESGPGARHLAAVPGYLKLDWPREGAVRLEVIQAGASGERCVAYARALEPLAPH